MPHDKNGVELKAGDRVTVECVVEEVSATPDHCNVKLKTVEPFHPNKEGNTNWFNTKQVVKVGLVMLAVLLGSSLVGAAPPPTSNTPPADSRYDDLEMRVAAIEKKLGFGGQVKAAVCPCPDGGKCVCDGPCVCESKVSAATAPKRGAPNPNPCILHLGYWWTWDGYEWKRGEADTTKSAAVAWDCSSGVCRPVSSSSVYGSSSPVYGGSCAGGSCGAPAASYGGGYGGFGGGVMSGGGSCSGASCGSSGGFRRR